MIQGAVSPVILDYFVHGGCPPLDADSAAKRFVCAVALFVAFAYPIYDVKHEYPGSHLANLAGEFFTTFALSSGVLGLWRWVRPPSALAGACDADGIPVAAWPMPGWFATQVLVFMPLSASKLLYDLVHCQESLDSPF